LASQHVENRQAGGARDGVSEKSGRGRRLAARIDPAPRVQDRGRSEYGRQRHSAPQGFSYADQIGERAVVVIAEPPAGAAETGVDLIDDEEPAPPASFSRHDPQVPG